MSRWEVQIFGKVPDTLEIEAETEEEARDMALSVIVDELDFQAEPAIEKRGFTLLQGGRSGQVGRDRNDDTRSSSTA